MTPVPMPETGPRILGFGAHADIAAAVQDRAREAGLRSTNFALADDAESDARLIAELEADAYDGVVIGAFINGQSPDVPGSPEQTAWFNRVLNIIHLHAPRARIVLVRSPADAIPAVHRVLGESEEQLRSS